MDSDSGLHRLTFIDALKLMAWIDQGLVAEVEPGVVTIDGFWVGDKPEGRALVLAVNKFVNDERAVKRQDGRYALTARGRGLLEADYPTGRAAPPPPRSDDTRTE